MARTIRVKVELSRQLKRNMDAGYLLGGPLKTFLKRATYEVRDHAVREAPVHEGRLRSSHAIELDGGAFPTWGKVGPNVKYGVYVHEGTRPHWAPIGALRNWAEKHGINPYALQRSIAQKGTKPNPWLDRAAESSVGKVMDFARRMMSEIEARWRA